MRDAELIYRALNLWANHVETGNTAFSAADVQRMGQDDAKAYGASIQALTAQQTTLVTRMRTLAIEQLKGERS